MRLIQSVAIAALICLAVGARADAGPTGTWIGVPASLSPADAPTQIYSVHTTASGATNINVTVRYSCPGQPSCTFSGIAGPFAPTIYVLPGGTPVGAPRPLFALVTSSACNTQYGAAALMGVWTGGSPSTEIDECLIPQGARPPGGPFGPVQQPHIRIPNIPPFVHRPAPIPAPNPGPLTSHP